MAFIIASFFIAYFFSGITNDVLRIVPLVVSNIEQALGGNKQNELEKKHLKKKQTPLSILLTKLKHR
jgi:hypothetical protein